ncbi:MAG: cobalt ECF transporter T component CbiQ [Synergistaceae bacterium]|nr:cobalt ECF transporter T component CbiQ [Synergistaceae bacterium]
MLYRASTGIGSLEYLATGDSPIHRLHPAAKLLTTLAYIVAVLSFASRNVSGLVPFSFYPALLMSLSGTPYRPLVKRLAAALPFALMGGISNLIWMRDAAFTLGGIPVTYGMLSFVSIMLKTLFSVFAVLILIATTSFAEVVRQLESLGAPSIVCLQCAMTYRYLSVLLDEASSMLTAYALRSPGQRGIKMKDAGSFLGQLILRSFDRAGRIYQAMKCRGFQGTLWRGKTERLKAGDWFYIVLFLSFLFVLRFFNLSLFLGRFFARLVE